MNTTFNSALKQSTSIRKDLAALSSHELDPTTSLTPAALGSLSASLTAFNRTIDEYNHLAKQELNAAKQEKAYERIRNFRSELHDFRTQLDSLKSKREEHMHAQNRTELLGRRPFVASTPENPYAASASSTAMSSATGAGGYGLASHSHARTNSMAESGKLQSSSVLGSGDASREQHALREQDFFRSTHSALDDYIARGQAVLGDLNQQREIMKNTQRKLYSVGNTLGISGDTIRMIERRAKQDKWIFWGGVVVFFLFCWLVLHYLR
ncbi:hypothetical protein QBC32DRAFT_317931 [Pseudoneurospora amorphoporcata]|uniref:Protein transport protein BOS1 n=1 Tax=Pseudoneurospora amorphoporcata TaxID=241081 RepID=A0AAN6NR65_9PEZI|nr:hypothetical protein QBC32DRAFT_317931 [Pseudoneurospora amorphoporcata]